MKIRQKFLATALGFAVSASIGVSQESSDETTEMAEKSAATPTTLLNYGSIQPEGKTLPEKVLRVRANYLFSQDNGKYYDKDGNDSKLNAKITGSGAAFVAEYGLSSKISLQLVVPYTLSQKVEADASSLVTDGAIQADASYQSTRDSVITQVAQGLVAAGAACGDLAGCTAYVNTNPALGTDLNLGELGTAPGSTPILTYINAALTAAARPGAIKAANEANSTDGDTGLGDIEVGVLYNVYAKEQLSISVGGGFRFATGKFTDAKDKPTGRGTTDLGLRLNFDYAPLDYLLLSWQNQTEVMLAKGKTKIGEDEVDFEREGALNKGFVQVAFATGKLHDSLKPFSVYSQYLYKVDAEERIDGNASGARTESYSVLYGVGASGLDYGIPVSLNVDFYETMAAKNTYGSKNWFANLKGYYKF